jgi:hypothetical protein
MKSAEVESDQPLVQLPPEAQPLKHIQSTCIVLQEQPDVAWSGDACREILRELRESVLQLMQADPNAEAGFKLTLPDRVDFMLNHPMSLERTQEVVYRVRRYVDERLREEFGL